MAAGLLDGVQDLVTDVVSPRDPAPFGAYVFGPDEPAAEIARALELEVLNDAFGNDAIEIAIEYGCYEASSVFVCVIDHLRRLPAGVIRLIGPSPGGVGLKSLDDIPRFWGSPAPVLLARAGVEIDLDATIDVATLAIGPDYRDALASGLVGQALYQSLVRGCEAAGVDHVVAVLDRRVYRMARVRYAEPFYRYGDARPYLGSPASHPVYGTFADWRERLRLVDPPLFDAICRGRGLEPAVGPVDPEELGAKLPRVPADIS